MSTIVYEKKEGIASIKLNRPEVLNAFNTELIEALTSALKDSIQDPELRVIIFSGAGSSFAAGFDLKQADEQFRAFEAGTLTPWKALELEEVLQELTRLQRNNDKVLIAAVHGWTIGAGLELTIACDLVIAAENTKFRFAELTAAMNITGGATKLLPLIVGLNRAKDWALSGRVITAEEAYQAGLVNKLVPLGEEEKEAGRWAETIRSNAPLCVSFHKKLINQAPMMDLEGILNLEKLAMLACLGSEDAKEAARAFAEKRTPIFKGK